MERLQFMIGRVLLIGVLLSFFTVSMGGFFYLLNHGTELVHYQTFYSNQKIYQSISEIVSEAATFSSLAVIQLGLLILVILQLVRVGMTTWIFIKLREKLFILMSMFILFVLLYSLFWKF